MDNIQKEKKNDLPSYYKSKDLLDEFPALKWILPILGIFLIIYLSKYAFNALAGSIEGFKNMRDAFRK